MVRGRGRKRGGGRGEHRVCLQRAHHRDLVALERAAGGFPALAAAYGAAGLLAYAVAGTAIVRGRRRNARPSGTALGAASLAYLAGLFAVRFGFYITHMTVGIG